LTQTLLVASGGAIGALSRFFLGNIFHILFSSSFFGTFLINFIGSFFIGYLISLGHTKNFSDDFIKYFLIIGFLGSFTTFSAFSYEVIELFLSKKMFLSILYIFASIFFCIVGAYIGIHLNRF
tara:strand:- start:54 stop:422 length:369 start_codon:yes stop_codon:yes gene_type:complete